MFWSKLRGKHLNIALLSLTFPLTFEQKPMFAQTGCGIAVCVFLLFFLVPCHFKCCAGAGISIEYANEQFRVQVFQDGVGQQYL